MIVVLAFLLGCANAVDMPVRQAFAIEMVGREDVGNAVALNSAMSVTSAARWKASIASCLLYAFWPPNALIPSTNLAFTGTSTFKTSTP